MSQSTKFAIVSGAGPMAGLMLYRHVIEILQKKGAWHDADFPHIQLQNVPFSIMLDGDTSNPVVRNELINVLTFLSEHNDHVNIACQTLHTFLTQDEIGKYKVISLLELIKESLDNQHTELHVIGSVTSRVFDLHSKMIGLLCHYVAPEKAEPAIDEILKGNAVDLTWVEDMANNKPMILGCTEFCVALHNSTAPYLIDPLKLAASDIVKRFVRNIRATCSQ